MPRGAQGPAELALRPLVLRRLPRRMAVALRGRGGNEEKVPHLQGQDPPVEGNGGNIGLIPSGRNNWVYGINITYDHAQPRPNHAPELAQVEEEVGADWDGVTVLGDKRKPPVVMPDHICKAIDKGNIKSVLRWINANRNEDRVNAISSPENMPALCEASMFGHMTLMSLLLQLGADVNIRDSNGTTALAIVTNLHLMRQVNWDVSSRARLLLSWGASIIGTRCSRQNAASSARVCGKHDLANLLESELGGRRCEIVNLLSRPELNGKTCVMGEFLPDSDQYKVTLETRSKEVLSLDSGNLKRRDRTPQDCGYYIEFKNGRTIRHDFDSNEDCRAFVAALNNNGESQPAVTEEAEVRAEQAAAELLAELELEDEPKESPKGGKTGGKTKKKKGGKKKK
ncbi:hypothetical protein THAOC_02761 [Thalassiosira oceanica]|uniref:Uncharacterized protein n=1 Tax=Thalassiosira oceanica TaxID=159749 RepID=K0T9U0_THAOC|nr:hypothetical protein THAOC_02761 [Thalassiosira oceanica]|eukprot:EJK75513.1 hypothetical protein THAOC_02761 [Thalassiosira oceanica]